MSSEPGHVSWSRDSKFTNASTSRRRVLIFCIQHLLSSNKNTLSLKIVQRTLIILLCGGEGNFKVRRLCKDFLAQFWGRGNSQTSYIVIRRAHHIYRCLSRRDYVSSKKCNKQQRTQWHVDSYIMPCAAMASKTSAKKES